MLRARFVVLDYAIYTALSTEGEADAGYKVWQQCRGMHNIYLLPSLSGSAREGAGWSVLFAGYYAGQSVAHR